MLSDHKKAAGGVLAMHNNPNMALNAVTTRRPEEPWQRTKTLPQPSNSSLQVTNPQSRHYKSQVHTVGMQTLTPDDSQPQVAGSGGI